MVNLHLRHKFTARAQCVHPRRGGWSGSPPQHAAQRQQHHTGAIIASLPYSVQSACFRRLQKPTAAMRSAYAAASFAEAAPPADLWQRVKAQDLIQANAADSPDPVYLEVLEVKDGQPYVACGGYIYRLVQSDGSSSSSSSQEGVIAQLELVGRQLPPQDALLKSYSGWQAFLEKLYAARPAAASIQLTGASLVGDLQRLSDAVTQDPFRWRDGSGARYCITATFIVSHSPPVASTLAICT